MVVRVYALGSFCWIHTPQHTATYCNTLQHTATREYSQTAIHMTVRVDVLGSRCCWKEPCNTVRQGRRYTWLEHIATHSVLHCGSTYICMQHTVWLRHCGNWIQPSWLNSSFLSFLRRCFYDLIPHENLLGNQRVSNPATICSCPGQSLGSSVIKLGIRDPRKKKRKGGPGCWLAGTWGVFWYLSVCPFYSKLMVQIKQKTVHRVENLPQRRDWCSMAFVCLPENDLFDTPPTYCNTPLHNATLCNTLQRITEANGL